MCGRYTLTVVEGFEDFYEIDERVHLQPRYNIAPTQPVPVILARPPHRRCLQMMHWGLIPGWSEGPAIQAARLINARSETAATRPTFKEAFAERRCLVAADGFYEWRKEGRAKTPIRFTLSDDGLFAFAGLWERWAGDGKSWLESTTILTTEPNSLVAPIHDRMPVILTRDRFAAWLDLTTPMAVLEGILQPLPSDLMRSRTANPLLNNARAEGPALLQEVESWRQRGLF